jgi:hypothetical protein
MCRKCTNHPPYMVYGIYLASWKLQAATTLVLHHTLVCLVNICQVRAACRRRMSARMLCPQGLFGHPLVML